MSKVARGIQNLERYHILPMFIANYNCRLTITLEDFKDFDVV